MKYRGSTAPASKVAWASPVAAALARIAVKSGDPVGLSFIGGSKDARHGPVSGGREAFERVVDSLESARSPEGDALANVEALDRALGSDGARAARRGSVVVILSDLLDLPPEAPDRIAAIATRGRVVVVVQVLDPDEATFPFQETVRLESLEGGFTVETDEAARERYLAALGALEDSAGGDRWWVGRGASFVYDDDGRATPSSRCGRSSRSFGDAVTFLTIFALAIAALALAPYSSRIVSGENKPRSIRSRFRAARAADAARRPRGARGSKIASSSRFVWRRSSRSRSSAPRRSCAARGSRSRAAAPRSRSRSCSTTR